MKETTKQYEERKSIFIARATKHFDTPKIRRQAEKLFNKANKENGNN